MIVLGFAPLVFLGLKDVGGWTALKAKLVPVAVDQGFAPDTWSHSWIHMSAATENPMGIGWFGMVIGLGFVLSFGYWCTDFLVVQRAMAADSMSAARRTPLIAAVPKMLFPALVILPGMIAIAINHADGGKFLPLGDDGTPNYNMIIPVMLAKYFPTGLLGIGFTALMASFMSGMAGNVTAFNTVWTYDIYQSYIAPGKSDTHYLWMGRWATVVGILISIGAAAAAQKFNNIMDMLQLVFGFVNAPLFATFLLGMFWKRTTGHGAFWGLLSGTGAAALFHTLAITAGSAPSWIKGGALGQKFVFHSDMGKNFWMAIVAWTTCFLLTVLISLVTTRTKTDEELTGLVYSLTPKRKSEGAPWYMQPVTLGILVLIATLALNLIFA
jgi:SSS family solute:Na+ symporter